MYKNLTNQMTCAVKSTTSLKQQMLYTTAHTWLFSPSALCGLKSGKAPPVAQYIYIQIIIKKYYFTIIVKRKRKKRVGTVRVTPTGGALTVAVVLWGCGSCCSCCCCRGSGRYAQKPVQEVIKTEDPPPATATHADEVVQVHLALCGQDGEDSDMWRDPRCRRSKAKQGVNWPSVWMGG